MGASAEAVATERTRAIVRRGWAAAWRIESLRRIWWSLPFLAASLIGFVSLAGLLVRRGVQPRRTSGGGSWRRASSRCSRSACIPLGRHGSACVSWPRTRARCCGSSPVVAVVVPVLSVGFALAPNLAFAVAMNALHHGAPGAARPGHPRDVVARHPAAGPLDGVLGGVAVDHPRVGDPADHRRGRRPPRHPVGLLLDGARVPHRWLLDLYVSRR